MEQGFWRVWRVYYPKQWLIWVKSWRFWGIFWAACSRARAEYWALWISGKVQLQTVQAALPPLQTELKLEQRCPIWIWAQIWGLGHLSLSVSLSNPPSHCKILQSHRVCEPSPRGWAGEQKCSHVADLLLTGAVDFPGSPGSLSSSSSAVWFSQCILDKAERSGGMSRDVEALCHLLRCLCAWLIIA